MSTKKEEERNEKVIRGLMKLPPNRKCINCNSLGPQYVCTNFWTFVCIACSGIHREFTHRVKSVSMAKFTSQEVEALQNGGNQRARETYLKDWDSQRHRFPDSSNADKVREFIKNVYVDRKYVGGKTSDKPPRDMQNFRNRDDETRRASSYHSYSQSPPYDHQYEDRRYGKQVPALSRKPGSDRGLYDGKVSSFLSPSRLNDHMFEDRFTNEGSISRASDYSVSSGGDPSRFDVQSPTLQRDTDFSSPSSLSSRDIVNEDGHHQTMNSFLEAKAKRDGDGILRPQRTASSSSFGSFDGNSASQKSVSFADVASEPEQLAGTHHEKPSSLPKSSSSVSDKFGGLDLFDAPFVPTTASFSYSAIDLFQASPATAVPTLNVQPRQTSSSSMDLFSGTYLQQSAATMEKKSADGINPKNEGWATFDVPHHLASNLGIENSASTTTLSADRKSLESFDPHLSLNSSMQWPSFQDSGLHGPSFSVSDPWKKGMEKVSTSLSAGGTQSWKAFEDYAEHLPVEGIEQSTKHVLLSTTSLPADQHLGLRISEELNRDGTQTTTMGGGLPIPSVPSEYSRTSHTPATHSLMTGGQSTATDRKSTNPFDLPYDSDLESSNMFLDMSPLQAALPNSQMPPSFFDGATEPWFSQNTMAPYVPNASQGQLGLMATQPPSSQIPNVPTQGPVASIGGNPFA